MNDNRPERSFACRPIDNGIDKTDEAYAGSEGLNERLIFPTVMLANYSKDRIRDEQERKHNHRLPPRSTDAIQPVRLGRREIERVHVLMGILDRRAKK
ncbi:MAG: hypothetical protein M9944_12805 [Rhizobiaceae bacterium]|nr:hypothetical protein [Rhizobiaceae bacterium]